MSKRVHEIAKERGLPAKEVLTRLQAAGLKVKAVSSSVDEAEAQRVLGPRRSAPTAPASAHRSGRPARVTTRPRQRPRPMPPAAPRPTRHRAATRVARGGTTGRPATRSRASGPPATPAAGAAS
jgi:translation initiation factor IF-2